MERDRTVVIRLSGGTELQGGIEYDCICAGQRYVVFTPADGGDMLVLRPEGEKEDTAYAPEEDPNVIADVLALAADARGLYLAGEGLGGYYHRVNSLKTMGGGFLRLLMVIAAGTALSVMSLKSFGWELVWMGVTGLMTVWTYAVYLCSGYRTGALREIFLGMATAGVILLPVCAEKSPWLAAGGALAVGVIAVIAWLKRHDLAEWVSGRHALCRSMRVQQDIESTRRGRPVQLSFIAWKRTVAAAAAAVLLITSAAAFLLPARVNETYGLPEERAAENLLDQIALNWETLTAEEALALLNAFAAHDAAALGMEPVTLIDMGDVEGLPVFDWEARTVTIWTRVWSFHNALFNALKYQHLFFQRDCVSQLTADGAEIPAQPYYAQARAWRAEQQSAPAAGWLVGQRSDMDAAYHAWERDEWYSARMREMPLMAE